MKNININEILVEWSYRCDRGFPQINKVEDREILSQILQENYGKDVAKEYMKSIDQSLDEVALGLNNSSLRHENEHERYNKKLINIFKTGGEVVIEREIAYTDENERDTSSITIPAKTKVKVDNEDEIIGKLIASLRGVMKYGPDFSNESEEAQKALRIAEKTFTYEDGSYKRIIPILYKKRKILVKLNDLSKDTVTGRLDKEKELKKSEPNSKKPKKSKSPKKRIKVESSSKPKSIIKHLSELTYKNAEEKEAEYQENIKRWAAESKDDKPSKYADRRDDEKDDYHSDRDYDEEDQGAAATDDEDEDQIDNEENEAEDTNSEENSEEEELDEIALEESDFVADIVDVSNFDELKKIIGSDL